MNPKTKSSHSKNLVTFFLQWLGPLAVFTFVLVSWQWAVSAWDISKFILPGPTDIWEAAVEHHDRLIPATIRTGLESLAGFSFSLILGFSFSAILSQSTWIRNCFLPYTLIFQTVPIIGVAPLIIIWFGSTFWSVVIISTFISIFPVINNTTTGLLRMEQGHWELFRLYQASRWQIFWKLQVPTCLPYAMAGAKIAAAASVLGACVGDFFLVVGENEMGLGFVIQQAKEQSNSLLFAVLVILTLLGTSFSFLTTFIAEKWILGDRHKKESGN